MPHAPVLWDTPILGWAVSTYAECCGEERASGWAMTEGDTPERDQGEAVLRLPKSDRLLKSW